MRDPVRTAFKIVGTFVTCIIGLRLVDTVLNRNNEKFGSYFKTHAFSWPQHYNIFLPHNKLDVNDEDDEITTDDIY